MKHVNDGVDSGAVPDASTISTFYECVCYGGELGSMHVIGAVELPVGDDRKSSNFINANDNFANEDYALAA